MAQILPPRTNLGSQIGQAAGHGFAQGAGQVNQVAGQQALLSKAFQNLQPANNPIDLAKQIAKIASVSPQAAQVIGPILQNQMMLAARNGGQINPNQEAVAGANMQPPTPQAQSQSPQMIQQPSAEFNPEVPPLGEEMQPVWTPAQTRAYENQLIRGGYSVEGASAEAKKQVDLQKEYRADASELAGRMLVRAKNDGLIVDPEDTTALEKFSLAARNSPNDNVAYQNVRLKMQDYNKAKANIRTSLDLGNPFSNAYRKVFGNYKDQKQISKDLQKDVNYFKSIGMQDELKNWLVNDLGFGNEQAHETVFPLSPSQEASIDSSFEKNTSLAKPFEVAPAYQEDEFPSLQHGLPQDKRVKFKDKMAEFLEKNPKVDLVTLRGKLNQEKRYDWHDVYQSIDELIQEGRFTPDIQQDAQLRTIRQAPIPGLGAYFQYLWTGKK